MIFVGGFIVVGPAVSGDVGGTVFGILIGAAAALYGVRLLRVSVVDRGDCLEIRNRFRTRRVQWADVMAVDYVERPLPILMRINMRDRWSALVTSRSGQRMYVDATESFHQLLYGRRFSQPLARGRAKADAIAEAWRSHGAT